MQATATQGRDEEGMTERMRSRCNEASRRQHMAGLLVPLLAATATCRQRSGNRTTCCRRISATSRTEA